MSARFHSPRPGLRRTVQAASLGLYLYSFFYVSWPYAQRFSNRLFSDKEWLPVESWLWLDPLVGLSTALAARCWNVALLGLIAIFALGLVLPRAFCGYLCPLGTLIDLFDSVIPRRWRRASPGPQAWWFNLRFYLLGFVLLSAIFGVLLAGFVSALPLLTRGLLFTGGQLQLGLFKNWSMAPPWTAWGLLSVTIWAAIFLLGLIAPRFWCRYVCPSGALMSLPSAWTLFRREVDSSCIKCGDCRKKCPFDAITADFSTRRWNCAFCQTCRRICPEQAIRFVPGASAGPNEAPQGISRRAMLLSSLTGAGTALAAASGVGAHRPIRPPGSVPEAVFLDLCIRCGQCIKVCPGPALQAAGLQYGFEALWTPVACFAHAGCHRDCNFCTQVCPTQAIEPLDLPRKRRTRIGLAVIDSGLCLPHRGERDCQLCFDECNAAGYRAIEMRAIQLPMGEVPEGAFSSSEVEEMGRIQAPFINTELCIGCGLCEYRCTAVNLRQRRLIAKSAIAVK